MSGYGIIFPSHFDNINKPDLSWEKEVESAGKSGFHISFLYEGMFGDTPKIGNLSNDVMYLYRGWIVKPQRYQQMSDLVSNQILTDNTSYLWSYDLNRWYFSFLSLPEELTPWTTYFSKLNIEKYGLEHIANIIKETFGNESVFVKDFLKSRKHEWYDACFIRNALDTSETIRIVNNLISLQGEDYHGGLVFRRYLDLKKIGVHPKSKMPLPLEYRVFFINQKPIFCAPYWNDGAIYPDNSCPPNEWLLDIGKRIRSPFVALDIAQDINNKWWVIEVNDGGSAGLPDHVGTQQFYNILYNSINEK